MYALFPLAQVAPTTTPAGPAPTGGAAAAPASTQIAVPGTPATQADKPSGPFDKFSGLLFPILIVAMLYLFLFRPKSKEAKQQKTMLEALKRGDRVMTIGGLIGSVVEVRGDEVVLKVDESNNVKERYIKSAIQKVLVDGDKAEDTKK